MTAVSVRPEEQAANGRAVVGGVVVPSQHRGRDSRRDDGGRERGRARGGGGEAARNKDKEVEQRRAARTSTSPSPSGGARAGTSTSPSPGTDSDSDSGTPRCGSEPADNRSDTRFGSGTDAIRGAARWPRNSSSKTTTTSSSTTIDRIASHPQQLLPRTTTQQERSSSRDNPRDTSPAAASATSSLNHHHHHHARRFQIIPPSPRQLQLEKLAAEASLVAGGLLPGGSLSDSSPRNESPAVSSTNTSGPMHASRLQHQPLLPVPETTASLPTSPAPSPSMSSSGFTPQSRPIPRTSSIDSAISTVSAQSGISHSHSSSTSSNPPKDAGAPGSAEVQSLIQTAGSAENLIQHMLKDKQSLTSQNAQLWRLVDKQRAMIVGLNKDLDRAMKDKDRYRKKLKEQMALAPSLPTSASTATVLGATRGMSESPAPSLDDSIRGESRQETRSPVNLPSRSESMPLPDRLRQGSTSSTPETSITMQPILMSPTEDQHMGLGEQPRDRTQEQIPSKDRNSPEGSRDTVKPIPEAVEDDSADSAQPDVAHQPDLQLDEREEILPERVEPTRMTEAEKPNPRVLTQAKKLALTTSVPPATGLHQSPLRKAPPARLVLSSPVDNPFGDEEDPTGSVQEIDGYRRAQELNNSAKSESSLQTTPADLKQVVAPALSENDAPRSAPLSRSSVSERKESPPGTADIAKQLSAGLSKDDIAVGQGAIKERFVRAPLPSPGLPSSPRPADRPANSPMPRGSRILSQQMGGTVQLGIQNPPRPIMQPFPQLTPGTPRASMPPPSSPFIPMHSPDPRLPGVQERSGHQKSASADQAPLLIQPSAIPSVDARVVSSRMRPSRMSMMPGTPKLNGDDNVFTLGAFSRSTGKELLRVEKDVGALIVLDHKLRKYIAHSGKVPDRALFSGHAPARIDARRAAIDEFFAAVLGATMDERAALALCEFFSTDVVGHIIAGSDLSTTPGSSVDNSSPKGLLKEGYLTKRGKNFGGWKERFFVLDGPVLKYFDGRGGAQLGQIKLQHAQIGRQNAKNKDAGDDVEAEYRHAFLVLEPKRKDSSTLVKHVLCAESDVERDEWVEALLKFVDRDTASEESKKKAKVLQKNKEPVRDEVKPVDENLRAFSYDQVDQGPAPARGPTPDETNRQHVSPSPSSSTLSAPQTSGAGPNSPLPDRIGKQAISGPTNGTVISDLAAWGSKTDSGHKTDKAAKKRSIWGIRRRSSSDLTETIKAQKEVERQGQLPMYRAVFGSSLEEAVRLTRPFGIPEALPAVVYRCIEYLEAKHASLEEGIFRLSGSNVVIKGLKDKFNTESDLNLLQNDDYYDVHAIAGLLKLYLRELPTNVLTSERREDFLKVTELGDKSKKIAALNALVHTLPEENFCLLKALSGHLLTIVDNSDINKMTIRNVGIVFSPTLNIPAQVFSMFLYEYNDIFVRDTFSGPSGSVAERPMSRSGEFTNGRPVTPQTPSTPLAPPPPMTQYNRAPASPSYEPAYEQIPAFPVPGNRNTAQFDGAGGGLSVPGSDGKSAKQRRRESSMMFMMGGPAGPKKAGMPFTGRNASTTMVAEESLYD